MARLGVAALLALVVVVTSGGGGAAQDEPACPDAAGLELPGVQLLQATCLEDLTTLSNPRTDRTSFGWGGSGSRSSPALNSAATHLPETPVPGLQLEGWFEGDSCSHWEVEHNSFMPACPDGHRRNGQFVLRVPNEWDGVHLVVAGAPGVRTQFANDIVISDFVLDRGWAYIAHDKGNTGLNFFRAGDDETDGSRATWTPPEAIAQWGGFMQKAALAGRAALAALHGHVPALTYAAGISNGGYQVRLALEQYPELFDGGVDWEGTLFTAEGPNLYTYIPPLLRAYPSYRATGNRDAYEQMVHEGRVPPDSQPVWDHHYSIYWGAVASTYRPVVDPEYTNYIAAPRLVVPPGDPDAEYDYFARPDVVHERVAELANTGETSGIPLITVHGTLDALLPISEHGDVYARMVRDRGNGEAFRYYVVEGGTHVDTAADSSPEVFRPLLPCFWDALVALDTWSIDGVAPPPSGFVPFPADATAEERANSCGLPAPVGRVAGEDRVGTSAAASRSTFGITQTVVVATAGAFPDALAAAPLAASLDAPVLLVGDALSDEVLREIERTGALAAVVVGGSAAVSDDVVAELEAEGLDVRRIAGVDRYATAAAIAAEVSAEDGEAFVASGASFADALAVGPVAAAAGAPILLTEPAALPSVTAGALDELGIERTVVVGGTAAVADEVLEELPDPTRVAGADRYETSAAIARLGLSRGHTIEEVYIATGRDFPDALAAGPVAAAGEWGAVERGLVLLVDGDDPAGAPAVLDLIRERARRVERALLFGGTGAISTEVEEAVLTALD